MSTKLLTFILGAAAATVAFGNTPKTPQSPVPNIETPNSSPVMREATADAIETTADSVLAAPAELTLPQKANIAGSTIEKTLPDQTLADQLAAKKAEQQKIATQKAQAQKLARQKAAAQKLVAQKAAAKKALAAKQAEEKPTKSGAPTLGSVTTEVEGDMTIITARMNNSPDWKDVVVEEHGTFLQVKLPGTIIPSSGEFIDGNGPFLKKIATFQIGDSDGAIRLFVNQDGAKAKLATTAEVLGDRIVMTIDHKKLEQLIAPPAKAKSDAPTAADVIAKTSVESSQPAPSDLISAAGTIQGESKPNSKSEPVQHLYNKLTKVAGFCAALFFAFLAVHQLRTKKGKKRSSSLATDEIEPATLKILSTINLGQKQRLSLVQVGSQQVLLGVSSESINMLTTIESRPTASFASQLQMANPNAEIRLKAPDELPQQRPQRRTLPTGINSSTTSSKGNASASSSINIAIDDDGPRVTTTKSVKKEEDITRILRDRLRNLPPG
jgi:flagellar biogenesis protein FliO